MKGGTKGSGDAKAQAAWKRLLADSWARAKRLAGQGGEDLEAAETVIQPTNKLVNKPVAELPDAAASDLACFVVEDDAEVAEHSVGSVNAVPRGGIRSKWGGKAPPAKCPGDRAATAQPAATKHPPASHAAAKLAAAKPTVTNSPPPKSIESTLRPYVVTNEELKATSKGLGYRLSKQSEDKDKGVTAAWGSTVKGIDEGDGWLHVAHERGPRFLPFTAGADNVTVLRPAGLRVPPLSSVATAAAPKQPGAAGQRPKAAASPSGGVATAAAPKQPGAAGQRPKAASPPGANSPAASKAASAVRQPPPLSNGMLGADFQWADLTPASKRPRLERTTSSQSVDMLAADRPVDLMKIVVNLYHVGHEFAVAVQKKDPRNERSFDWEGVRRGILSLKNEMGLEVVGVIFENWKGPDNLRGSIGVPPDVKALCAVVMEAPRLTGSNQQRADDEMAIKCAMRRNCLFLTKKGYDWLAQMRDTRCRTWLEMSQNMLQVSYSFLEPFGKFKAQSCSLDGSDGHLGTD